MVEFGLKLQDNKVSEWEDKYIDYEKLKSLLKKAKSARAELEHLKAQDETKAAEIVVDYEANHSEYSSQLTSVAPTPSTSELSLSQLTRSTGSTEMQPLISAHKQNIQEKGGAAAAADGDYYGSQSKPGLKRTFSASELTMKVLQDVASGIGGYFQRDNYSSRVRKALKDKGVSHKAFSRLMFNELSKVNTFYGEKLSEITKRLDVLIKTVELTTNGGSFSDVIPVADIKHDNNNNNNNNNNNVDDNNNNHDIEGQETKTSKKKKKKKKKFADAGYDSDNSHEEPHHVAKSKKHRRRDSYFKDIRESDSIKRALRDLYRQAKLLVNYISMNYTGFVKIVKKFDKTLPEHKGEFKDIFHHNLLSEGKEGNDLGERMEALFAQWFCSNNVGEARVQIIPKRGDSLELDWSHFRLGYRLGMCAILALWVCWDCIWGLVKDGHSTIGGRTAFPVFRACGGLLLIHWFWGFSTFIWSRYRINYIYLFDFDPRVVATPMSIFNDVVDETLVFLLTMLLYYKSGANDIPEILPPGFYPFMLVLYTLYKLIIPWHTRGPLWKAIVACLTAPLTSPSFFHTYVADVFTSMVKVFQDMLWTACFFISGDFLLSEDILDGVSSHSNWQETFWYKKVVIPLICLFPLWIRFNQCLRRYMDTGKRNPNLLNAFKYALSQTVTLFGTFHPLYMLYSHDTELSIADLTDIDDSSSSDVSYTTTKSHFHFLSSMDLFQIFWMTIFVSSSLYSFFWDLYMDWGLGRPKYAFLGPRLMFPNKFHYYGVIVADLFLRFMWVLTLVPPQSGASFELPNYMTAVTMSLELLRRTLWGFFRLEREHRSNTDGYRRVDFVPLHFNTGHSHKYIGEKGRAGWHVLAEVSAVSVAVIAVCVSSVLAAQRATRLSQEGV